MSPYPSPDLFPSPDLYPGIDTPTPPTPTPPAPLPPLSRSASAPPPPPQHFALPFSFAVGPSHTIITATNAQDSNADVDACVEAIARTTQGQRDALPTFGRPTILFETDETAILTAFQQSIDQHEPRVQSLLDLDVDDQDEALWHIRALYQFGPDEGDEQ